MNLEEFQEIFSSARLNQAEQRVVDQKKHLNAEHQRKIKELDEAIRQSKVIADKDQVADHLALFPYNYKVLTQRVDGLVISSDPSSGVEGDVASFDIELIIRVMSSKWTTIPIANTTSMVASNWGVSWLPEEINSTYEVLDPVADSEAMLLIKDDQQVLATNKTGLFRVRFTAHSRVRKDRKLNSVSLSSLLYPLSGASTMRLCAGDWVVSPYEGLVVKELSISPIEAVLKVQPDNGCAKVQLILPLTAHNFEIRWLDIVDAVKEKKAGKPGVSDKFADEDQQDESLITVIHDAMHTVEEGVIRSTNVLQFETSADSINSVEFKVHGTKGTRVTSVSGYALSRWTAAPYNTMDSTITVHAYFKSSNLDSSMTLHAHTESDVDTAAKTQELELPRIECMGVLRQNGHIGVIKVANNVELHQHKAVGLARAEPKDISSQLRLNTDRPIMLAYKYLNPKYDLRLSSTSHTAMDTLEAVADRVHYEALVMDSHIMHSLVVMLRSTKLQYLAIQGIPSDASMFTLIVNGIQTKPVKAGNRNNSILIPLLVGLNTEAANDGIGAKTSIELRYFSTQDPLGETGTICLPLPHVTIPVSVVTTELRLPKTYSYNFTGDFGSNTGSDSLDYPVPSAFSYVKGRRIVPKDYFFSRMDDAVEEDETSQGESTIQMDIPQSGRSYFFQRLLVVDKSLFLNATYFPRHPTRKLKPSLWDELKSYFG